MLIRKETEKDFEKVYIMIKEAFEIAEHADGNEQDLVVALRKSEAFVPQLSLVAEIDGQIVGHILFTESKVSEDIVLSLAPLSVSPNYQKQGVGTALILEGHRIAKELGYNYILVLGSDRYYPRFGYLPASSFGVSVPKGIPKENFMAIQLNETATQIKGNIIYAKEFGV